MTKHEKVELGLGDTPTRAQAAHHIPSTDVSLSMLFIKEW
jgi:hypothetical protein